MTASRTSIPADPQAEISFDPQWPPLRRRASAVRPAPAVLEALAELMRPDLPELAVQIADEVQQRIAEYGPGPDGVNLTSTLSIARQAIDHFVTHIADPDAQRHDLDESLRRMGRSMAYEGRSLDSLRSAYHIGAGLGWKQIRYFAARQGLGADALGDLGGVLFEFIESLAEQSTIGFHEAQAQLSDAAHQWRGRALELVLTGQSGTHGELAAHAAAGGWVVPDRVALIAVRPTADVPLPAARMLHPQALAALHCDQPAVLLPAPLTTAMHAELRELFADHRIAIGCEVSLADAASSLRWARRALDLASVGAIADAPVIDCRDHVAALWINAEPQLVDLVASTTLAPLFAEPPNSRRILAQTLLQWISSGNPAAPALAQALGIHPQTVRYRLKRLRAIFGDRLDEPASRLEMFLGLMALAPEWNDGPPVQM